MEEFQQLGIEQLGTESSNYVIELIETRPPNEKGYAVAAARKREASLDAGHCLPREPACHASGRSLDHHQATARLFLEAETRLPAV